jgi:hypothetical protein
MANENVNGEAKTFLNDMLVFDFSLTTKGPCGLGGKHDPNRGNT